MTSFLAFTLLFVQKHSCLYVTLHAKRGLIQISRYGFFHGLGREIKKNYWNVSEISPTHREHAMKKVTATVKYFTP